VSALMSLVMRSGTAAPVGVVSPQLATTPAAPASTGLVQDGVVEHLVSLGATPVNGSPARQAEELVDVGWDARQRDT
jgi:hypothetical protein